MGQWWRQLLPAALAFGFGTVGLAVELGDHLPKSAVVSHELIMVNPGQLKPVYRVREQSLDMKVCWDEKKGISYIEPLDSEFVTPEGAKAGMSYKQVRKVAAREARKYPGYLFTVELPSGWYVGFAQGSDRTEGELKDDAKAIVIFKSSWLW